MTPNDLGNLSGFPITVHGRNTTHPIMGVAALEVILGGASARLTSLTVFLGEEKRMFLG